MGSLAAVLGERYYGVDLWAYIGASRHPAYAVNQFELTREAAGN